MPMTVSQPPESRPEMAAQWYLKTEDASIFGPVSADALCEWARQGRIVPGHFVSADRTRWQRAESVHGLEMAWKARLPDGSTVGPVHLQALVDLLLDRVLTPETVLTHAVTGEQVKVADRANQILGLPEPEQGAKVLRLQARLGDLERGAGSSAQAVADAKADAEQQKKLCASLQARAQDAERALNLDLKRLKEELAEMSARGRKTEEELRQERAARAEERTAARRRETDLLARVEKAEKENADLVRKLGDMRSEFERARSQADAAVAEARAGEQRLLQEQESLRAEVNRLAAEAVDARREMAQLHDQAKALQAEGREREARLLEERDSLKRKTTHLAASAAESAGQLEQARDQLQQIQTRSRNREAELQREIDGLKRRHAEEIVQRQREMESRAEWVQQRLAEAAERARDADGRAQRAEKRYQDASAQWEQAKTEFESRVAALERECAETATELAKRRAAGDSPQPGPADRLSSLEAQAARELRAWQQARRPAPADIEMHHDPDQDIIRPKRRL